MCLIFVSIYMVPRYKCWYDSDAAHSLIQSCFCFCPCIWSVKPTIFIFLFFNLLEVIQSREIFLFLFPSFFSSWTCFMSFTTKKWQRKKEKRIIFHNFMSTKKKICTERHNSCSIFTIIFFVLCEPFYLVVETGWFGLE